jgi:membrane-associated phospholipid phosphatase
MLLNTPKKKITALFVVFLVSTIIAYLYIDERLAVYLKNTIPLASLKILSLITAPIEPLIVPLYILLFLKIFEHSSKIKDTLINYGTATISAIVFTSFLKLVLARPRPSFFLSNGISHIMPLHFNEQFVSMPSGHAAGAGLIVAMIYLSFKGKLRLLMTLPIILALFRIASLKHFLSDVILGFGIGFCMILIYHLPNRTIIEKIKDRLWKNGKIG